MSRLTEFLESVESSTAKSYAWCLRLYFGFIYGHPVTQHAGQHTEEERVLAKKQLEEDSARYFSEKRDYEQDVKSFSIDIKNRAPKSRRLAISVVRVFLMENHVELSTLFWKRLNGRIHGNAGRTQDRVPSNPELRSILTHMPIQGRALYLTLSSSGMRIGEALKLEESNVNLESEPARIQVRGANTKSGDNRIVFISKEAVEAIRDWLKVRSQYLDSAVARSAIHSKTREDSRIFPFSSTNAYALWYNAVAKSGLKEKDNGTRRYTLHPHVLRKFYRTRLGGVIPVDVVETLMGHNGYLTSEYRRYTEEDLAGFYMKGEYALHVFSNGAEIGKEIQKVKEEKTYLESFVTEALRKKDLEIQELRTNLSKVDLTLAKIEQILREQLGVKNPSS